MSPSPQAHASCAFVAGVATLRPISACTQSPSCRTTTPTATFAGSPFSCGTPLSITRRRPALASPAPPLRRTARRDRTRRRKRASAPRMLSAPELADVAYRSSEAALQRVPVKRLVSWGALLVLMLCVRPFFPVLVGTFIVGYVANSVVRAVARLTRNRAPRRLIVGIFYTVIVTAISGFSLMTIPTVIRESQYFVSTLQSENPYVYVANSLRRALGDELTTKVEAYVMYTTQPPMADALDARSERALPRRERIVNVLPPAASSSSSAAVPAAAAASLATTEWTAERSRRLGMLLQRSLREYVAGTASLITKLIGASTKVVLKAALSLLFSFMLMWDLPVIASGVRRLRTSRLSFMYDELAPVVTQFGSVLGKSFEAQGLIACVNTTMTTAGLLMLSVPGVGFLSLVTLLCSFIPVVGVFISTLPMCMIALSEFGVAKALWVIVMVIVVHLIEAYILNPQIYSAHLHLHPLMVLTVLYVAEHSYGIPGLLLAVPVAVYILRAVILDGGEEGGVKEIGAAATSTVGGSPNAVGKGSLSSEG